MLQDHLSFGQPAKRKQHFALLDSVFDIGPTTLGLLLQSITDFVLA